MVVKFICEGSKKKNLNIFSRRRKLCQAALLPIIVLYIIHTYIKKNK